MRKKIISVLAISAMCVSMLLGCSVSTETGEDSLDEDNASGQEKTTENETEISWIFYDDLDVSEDLVTKGYKEVIERFNEDYAGKYHVNVITTPTEEYDTKLNALIASGNARRKSNIAPKAVNAIVY